MGWSTCRPLLGSEHKNRSHCYSCCDLADVQCSGQYSGISEQLLRTEVAAAKEPHHLGPGWWKQGLFVMLLYEVDSLSNKMMFVTSLPQQTTYCLYTFNVSVDTAFLFILGVSYLTMHAGSHYLPPTIPTTRH